MVKVHILFEFRQGPWGGGNQFLKSLKKYVQSVNGYDENVATAQVILFNSHQCIGEVIKAKLSHPEKIFIHRIDGPIRLYNQTNDRRDNIVFAANRYLAEATVFQSAWSQQQNHLLGLQRNLFETMIPNAPEPSIFNRQGKRDFSDSHKIRLIATSWSQNWNKGFDTYQWLDENLDFNKYEMVFVGKSPVQFKNIRHISPLSSGNIADKLKQSDIFIFASPIEACSNSLLEALHCGLPAVGPDQSSTPELIGRGGETFTAPSQIPDLLEKITNHYSEYQAYINNPPIEQVGGRYYNFISEVYHQVKTGEQKTKSFGRLGYFRIQMAIFCWRLSERIDGIIARPKTPVGS
jgi:hypothetical protein